MGGRVASIGGALLPLIAAAGVVTFGIGGALGALIVGGSALLGGFIAKSDLSITDLEKQGEDTRFNSFDTQRTVGVIYGKKLVGSNDVFIAMSQDIGGSYRYVWIVSCLGEGECQEINQVYYGDPPVLVDEIYIGGRLAAEYDTGVVEYTFHSGTNFQTVDTDLFTAIPTFTDPLRNTAYIVYKFDYKEIQTAFPKREVVLKGLKIIDYRTASLVWSRNPAIILHDYITNTRYGLGWGTSIIDYPSWESAANYCDSRGWAIDYEIGSQSKSQSIIETILGHFRGSLSFYSGHLYLHISDLDYESEVFSITDEHIARDDSGKALVSVSEPSRFNLPEAAVIKYVNADHGKWTFDDIQIGESQGQVVPIEFPAYTERGLALNMGTYVLERSRLNRAYTLTMRPDTVVLDVNDVVRLTSSELGLGNVLARVKASSILSNGLTEIVLIEENTALYDQDYDDTSSTYHIDFPSIYGPPPPVENVTFEEIVYTYRERTYVRLIVKWDPPAGYAFYDRAEVTVANLYVGPYISAGTGIIDRQLDPVEEKITYYFKIYALSTEGARSVATEASHYVTGISTQYPPSPTDLTVSASGTDVYAYSSDIYDPNIANLSGWVFRISPITGVDWWGALFLSQTVEPSINIYNIIPNDNLIWINSLGTNGLYGEYPLSELIDLDDPPPNYSIYYTEALDYTTGTHDNTIAVNVGGEYRLQCAHVGGILTGTWTSAEIELDYSWVTAKGKISYDNFYSTPPPAGFVLSSEEDWANIKVGTLLRIASTVYSVSAKANYGVWRGTTTNINVANVNPPSQIVEFSPGDFLAWLDVQGGGQFRWSNPLTPEYTVLSKSYTSNTIEIDTETNIITPSPCNWRYLNAVTIPGGSTSWSKEPFEYSFSPTDLIAYLVYSYTFDASMQPYNTAGNLKISIFYSDTSGGPYKEAKRAEIFYAIITGRYIKIAITITDPDAAVHLQVRPATFKTAIAD